MSICHRCGSQFINRTGPGAPWRYCPICRTIVKRENAARRKRRERENNPPPAKRREPAGPAVSVGSGLGAAPQTARAARPPIIYSQLPAFTALMADRARR
jgi:hypothetical protein